ncbi:hydrogenase maturation protease [Desulfovibrionales bacterium]
MPIVPLRIVKTELPEGQMRLLVMGVGNILLSDDGAGIYAVQELEKEVWPPNVTMLDGGTFTQDIYHIFEGFDELIVLDVVHARHTPGTIYRLTEDDLIKNEDQRLSLHDIDLLDSLYMADLIGKRPKMRVLGIQPENFTTWNIGLTPTLQKAFPKFVEAARQEVLATLAEHGISVPEY